MKPGTNDHRMWVAAACVALASCRCSDVDSKCDWTQWGQGPSHRGNACTAGQSLNQALARVEFDPFAAQEQAETADWESDDPGSLLVHYPTPLIVGDWVYVMV